MLVVSIQVEDLLLHLLQRIFVFIILICSYNASFWKYILAYTVFDATHQVHAFSRSFGISLSLSSLCRRETESG